MPRYAVLIYDRVEYANQPEEVRAGHAALPDRVAEAGGRIVAGLAWQDASTATTVRGELLTDGPFIETKEEMAGMFVLEARDLDHALRLARMTPVVEGAVEVRPLLGFEVLEGS